MHRRLRMLKASMIVIVAWFFMLAFASYSYSYFSPSDEQYQDFHYDYENEQSIVIEEERYTFDVHEFEESGCEEAVGLEMYNHFDTAGTTVNQQAGWTVTNTDPLRYQYCIRRDGEHPEGWAEWAICWAYRYPICEISEDIDVPAPDPYDIGLDPSQEDPQRWRPARAVTNEFGDTVLTDIQLEDGTYVHLQDPPDDGSDWMDVLYINPDWETEGSFYNWLQGDTDTGIPALDDSYTVPEWDTKDNVRYDDDGDPYYHFTGDSSSETRTAIGSAVSGGLGWGDAVELDEDGRAIVDQPTEGLAGVDGAGSTESESIDAIADGTARQSDYLQALHDQQARQGAATRELLESIAQGVGGPGYGHVPGHPDGEDPDGHPEGEPGGIGEDLHDAMEAVYMDDEEMEYDEEDPEDIGQYQEGVYEGVGEIESGAELTLEDAPEEFQEKFDLWGAVQNILDNNPVSDVLDASEIQTSGNPTASFNFHGNNVELSVAEHQGALNAFGSILMAITTFAGMLMIFRG